MLAIVNSCAVFGMDAYQVKVEVDVSGGMPAFDIVGLPDAAVRESRERVRTAIRNSGFDFPMRRITVNLAPADLKKEGACFDLAIACGILLATEQLKASSRCNDAILVGELSLDGSIRGVNGVLAMAQAMPTFGLQAMIVAEENAEEAALLGSEVYGLPDLAALVRWWNGELDLAPISVCLSDYLQPGDDVPGPDMSDVKGQEAVKRALEIAAAGGHNILLTGAPGSGKTMLARRMPTILPDFTPEESLATTRIYSVAGELPKGRPLIVKRPFRAPHHTASAASVIGGGRVPRPGEVSLAHNGVLFLDELPEFSRDVLEALRQPLEDKIVSISRVNGRMEYQAAFQLVGAMNPCPCGFHGDPVKPCRCTPHQINRYTAKISGPLLDRIDMQVHVQRVDFEAMQQKKPGDSSAVIKARVTAARKLQLERLAGTGVYCNADMERQHLEKYCRLTADAQGILQMAFKQFQLSARAHDRILKVARTIADLAGESVIGFSHMAEALQYRSVGVEDN